MASGTNAQMVVTIALFFGIVMESPDDAQVGVCYSQLGDNLPPPAEVVALYRQHNIGRMRIYFPDPSTLQALRGSNIELTLGVARKDIRRFASNASTAADWVRSNVLAYWPDVRFRYIVVGNQLIPDATDAPHILPAMRNVHGAISSAGLRNSINVSTAVNRFVLVASSPADPPSAGEFTDAARAYMVPIVQFLASTGAPLLANIYPYFSYTSNPTDASLDYALFTAPKAIVSDPPYSYQNLFDAILDSLHAALEKVAGGPSVRIVVSGSGWPSAGATAATVRNAQTYNQNLIRHASRGTPRRPGMAIETYVLEMFNENQKVGPETERNFGLFYPNKTPVYPINF